MDYKKNLVSCVTPVYNGAQYLSEMLDSVLAQTWPFIQMILVNDGSKDSTLEIAKSYQDKFREKRYDYHIITIPHKNAAAAINAGLPFVRGEYLIWPDSDDILEQDSVKKRVDYLTAHPEYKCVRSIMYYFNPAGSTQEQGEILGNLKKEYLFFDIIESRTFVCCGCYMLKAKEFFSIYSRRKIPEYPVGQNFQMLLPYMYRYPCPTISEKLYGVRIRSDSDSRKKRTQEEEAQRIRYFERLVNEIADICKMHSLYEKRRIACWKIQQRRNHARRHKRKLQAAGYSFILFLYGRSRFHKYIFDFIRRLPGWENGNKYE